MCNTQSLKPLLLVRPAPHPCEGVPEYVQRIAKANGFRSANEFAGLLGIRLNHIVKQREDRILAVIQGKADPDVLRMHTGNLQFLRSYGGTALSSGRVCPHCLAESDILSSDWSLPLSISCPRHQTVLLDRCPRCHASIRRSDSLYRCRCGQDFRKIDSPPAPFWERQYFELFAPWRALPNLTACTADVSRLETLAGRITRRLLRQVWPENPEATDSRLDRLHSWIHSDDHTRLAAICRDEEALAETTLQVFPNFTPILKNPYARLAAETAMPPPRILLLTRQLQVERGVAQRRNRLEIREARKVRVEAHNRVAQSLGVPPSVVSRLLRIPAWLKAVRTLSGEPEASDILRCVHSCVTNTVSVKDWAQTLGVSVEFLSELRELRSPRMIRLPPKHFERWRIHKTLAEELGQIVRTTQSDKPVALNHAIRAMNP